MTWTRTDDLEEFLSAAGAFLRSGPTRHTVPLTVASSLRAAGSLRYGDRALRYGWWRGPDGTVDGAFLWTPPYPVLLAEPPGEAVEELVPLLLAGPEPLRGVNGGSAAAEAFADLWQRHTGGDRKTDRTHRLYRLGGLTPPDPPPPGRARTAVAADRELLIEWYDAFGRETPEARGDSARAVDDRLGEGGFTVWEAGGRPAAMAGITRTVAGMARVAPVYTPPDLRRRGYAGAVTAAVSRAALDAGVRDVLLFTDLDNPTSNALYRRLGYRPVADHLVISFTGAPVRPSSASSSGNGAGAPTAATAD